MAMTCHDPSYGAENEYRIALIGRTGTGKSSTGNNILGEKAFISKTSGSSITKKCNFHTAERFGKKLVVVDTPGLFDTELGNEVVTKEIVKCIGMLAPGPHTFVLVVQIGRFTEEEHNTVMHFSSIFGEEFFRYLILLFTRKDDLENEESTIDEYVKDVPADLKHILQRCDHKYLAFDNTLRGRKNDKDVRQLVSMVKDIMEKTGKSYYSNDLFEKAEREFQKRAEESRRMGEENIEKMQEELKAAKEEIKEQEKKARASEEELKEKQRNIDEERRQHDENMKHARDNDRRKYENEDNSIFDTLGYILSAIGKTLFGWIFNYFK